MKILSTQKSSVNQILSQIKRAQSQANDVENIVRPIMEEVRTYGDEALFRFTKKFDGAELKSLQVSSGEIKEAYQSIDKKIIESLKKAKKNIEKFHQSTITKKESVIETQPGVKVWREFRPIEKVGLYVPGGLAAYPSTVLMLAIPANVAGCSEVIMTTPANKDGKCNPAVLVATDLCGVKKIFKVGGAQAIAAMTYGTESVPKVYKVVGPGNQYVTTAKMLAYGQIDIDMPAGPSEVLVLADSSANPKWVAADLLSQLEHGIDSQAILVTTSNQLANDVKKEMMIQMKSLSRQSIIKESLKRSFAIVVKSVDEGVYITNEYAPEHLEIICKNESQVAQKINNAGSIFLGKYTSEPLGDYATGANHTLPTSGFAKMFSALSADSFGKMIQFQKVSQQGLKNLRNTVETLAEAEGLDAHKRAISIRFN